MGIEIGAEHPRDLITQVRARFNEMETQRADRMENFLRMNAGDLENHILKKRKEAEETKAKIEVGESVQEIRSLGKTLEALGQNIQTAAAYMDDVALRRDETLVSRLGNVLRLIHPGRCDRKLDRCAGGTRRGYNYGRRCGISADPQCGNH